MRQSPFTGWLETSGPRLTSALRGAWLDLWGGRLSMRVCYAAIPFITFGTSLVGELRNIQVPRSAAVTVGILLLLAVILLSSRGDPSRSEALCSYWGMVRGGRFGGLSAQCLAPRPGGTAADRPRLLYKILRNCFCRRIPVRLSSPAIHPAEESGGVDVSSPGGGIASAGFFIL